VVKSLPASFWTKTRVSLGAAGVRFECGMSNIELPRKKITMTASTRRTIVLRLIGRLSIPLLRTLPNEMRPSAPKATPIIPIRMNPKVSRMAPPFYFG